MSWGFNCNVFMKFDFDDFCRFGVGLEMIVWVKMVGDVCVFVIEGKDFVLYGIVVVVMVWG